MNTTNGNSEIAQFVILDVGIPNPAQISEAVLTSVGNILCISQGSSYIPAFGLALINASYQPVIRLSSVQTSSKLQKVLYAINSVKDTGKCRARIPMADFQDYTHLGIKTAIEDFEDLSNHLSEEDVFPEKLQITVFSMKNLSESIKHIQRALPLLKVHCLSKIVIAELVEEFLDQSCLKKSQSLGPFLEYLQVAGTVRRLDELMKQWLVSADMLHVKLDMNGLIIWCDARDCLIRPSSKTTFDADTGQGSTEEVDNEEDVLEVLHRLPTEGVCETHIFGDPVLLMPCRCQNHLKPEDNEELTHNLKFFLDLCNKLGVDDDYLIAKYEKRNQPIRFILLMPGAGFLLAKELISAEMAFPVSDISKSLSTYVTSEVDPRVTTALVSFPSISSYDPGDFSSGLYKYLFKKIQHPTSVKMETLCHDPPQEAVVVGIEVKKKTKLKRKNSISRRRPKRSAACDLPQLTENDQQTLESCFTKRRPKFKSSSPSNC